MPRPHDIRLHEVSFCADVKSWADALLKAHPEWPFTKATIEEYGTGNYKRQDIRVYREGSNTPVLTGEVKMPGTPEGRSPYDSSLMQDAFNKADNIQAPYFFTWNVNTFVLFDRSRYNRPMIERRLDDWQLGLGLTEPGDCKRPEVQAYIRDKFLPTFFERFAAIVLGQAGEWGKSPDEVFIRSLESHLDWPVVGTRDFLAGVCQKDSEFAQKLQLWMSEEMNWTFDPTNPDNWRKTLDNAARTLCYVFSNRAIFYEAIRARYPDNLPVLKMPKRGPRSQQGIYDYFRARFQQGGDPDSESRAGESPQSKERGRRGSPGGSPSHTTGWAVEGPGYTNRLLAWEQFFGEIHGAVVRLTNRTTDLVFENL